MTWRDKAIRVDGPAAGAAGQSWRQKAVRVDQPAAVVPPPMQGQGATGSWGDPVGGQPVGGQASERSLWDRAVGIVSGINNAAGQVRAGAADALAGTVGGVMDFAAQNLPVVGERREPGYWQQTIRGGIDAINNPFGSDLLEHADANAPLPQNTAESLARGAGGGVVDAASFLIPGTALARIGSAGGKVAKAGQWLTASPGLQTASGAVGGAVTEATDNPWLGAGAALAVPFGASAARRAVTPFSAAIDTGSAKGQSVAKAIDDGFGLTPAQQTGNQTLARVERSLGVADDAAASQRKQVNQKALASIGEAGDEVTPEILERASQRIGGSFDDLAGRTKLKLDGGFLTVLDDVERQHLRRLPTNQRPALQSYVDDFRAMVQSGKTEGYAEAASGLRRSIRQYQNSDPELAMGLRKIAKALDDAVDASADPALRSEWQTARKEWRNLLKLEKAQKGTGAADTVDGDLGLTQVRKAGQGERGELGSAANMAELMLAENAKAARGRGFVPFSQQVRDTGRQIMSGGGAYLLGADPMTAGAVGVAAPYVWAGAKAAGRAVAKPVYESGPVQKWVANQAFSGPAWDHGDIARILAAQAAGNRNRGGR